jgi:hypothetical protein
MKRGSVGELQLEIDFKRAIIVYTLPLPFEFAARWEAVTPINLAASPALNKFKISLLSDTFLPMVHR